MAREPATAATMVKLLLLLLVVAGVSFGISLMIAEFKAAVGKGKGALKDKGLHISKDGVKIKTDRRKMTLEETQDKLQASLMKGWKNTTFEIPYLLGKATGLAGSSHDKNKAAHDATHGSKLSKKSKNL